MENVIFVNRNIDVHSDTSHADMSRIIGWLSQSQWHGERSCRHRATGDAPGLVWRETLSQIAGRACEETLG